VKGTAGIELSEARTDLAVGPTRFDQGQERSGDRRNTAATEVEAAAAVVVGLEPEAEMGVQHQWPSHSTQAGPDDIPVRYPRGSVLQSVDEHAVRQAALAGGRSLAVEPILVETIPPVGDAAEAVTGPAD
jgi:hypothetical protein